MGKSNSTKKIRYYWFRNKDVVASRKVFERLKQDKRSHVKEISNIIEDFNSKSSDVTVASDWLDKLPLATPKEFEKFEAGEEVHYNLQVLKERQRLRKKHDKKVEDLTLLESKVKESQIDLLLSKVKCMKEKLSTTPKLKD